MSRLYRVAPTLLLLGLALLVVGERVLGGTHALRLPASGLGALLVVSAWVTRRAEQLRYTRDASPNAAAAAATALIGYTLCVLSLGLYIWWQYASAEPTSLERVAFAGFMISLVVGLPVALTADWSRGGLTQPERIELRRVRGAAAGAATLGLAASSVFVLNALARDHDRRWDWGGITTVIASTGTAELVDNLDEPVDVTLFYPPASDTLQAILPYFTELANRSPLLAVDVLDQAIEPQRASALGVVDNGTVVVARGGRQERIVVPVDLKLARGMVTDLDRTFQERLLRATYERRNVSFTVGHGELKVHREELHGGHHDGHASAREPIHQRRTTRNLRNWLKTLNVTSSELGADQGLGRDIAQSAGIVAVIAPTEALAPEEADSLLRFVDAGGSLFIALEPDARDGLKPLLSALGVKRLPGLASHERLHRRRTGATSDRRAIVTNRYGTHLVARTLAQHGGDAYVTFNGAAALAHSDPNAAVIFSAPGTWRDLDGDGIAKAGEPPVTEALALALARGSGRQGGRVFIIGDADVLTDAHISGPGPNLQLVTDALAWLAHAGDTQLRVTEPERDPPLIHTRDEDTLWFWLTIVGVPLAVFCFGLLWVRRRGAET